MKDRIKKGAKYLFIGIVSLIPAVITLQVIIFIYNLFLSLIVNIQGVTNSWSDTLAAILLSLAFVVLIGHSVVKHGSSGYILLIDKLVLNIPLFNKIYSVIKKLLDLFFNDKKEFSEVVFLEYPRKGIWVPGYVTNKINSSYILFVPTSPNPTSGFTVIVREEEIIKSDISMEDATTFIVSIGVDLDSGKIKEELKILEGKI